MGKKLPQSDYLKIKKNIIKKLYANKAFTKGHLLRERLIHGIPSHLAGFVEDILNDLLKEGLVLHYGKTKHGDAYQLNVKRLSEIEKIIL